MTKEEFIEKYFDKTEESQEDRNAWMDTHIVLPCNCYYEGCEGWGWVRNRPMDIMIHENQQKQ